jgi:hypothetical protein
MTEHRSPTPEQSQPLSTEEIERLENQLESLGARNREIADIAAQFDFDNPNEDEVWEAFVEEGDNNETIEEIKRKLRREPADDESAVQ